ncbi:putative glycoside hydrolase, partial [Pseudoalteromonas sp. 41-MNA-CIBAN-0057]
INATQALQKPLWLGLACEGDCRKQIDIAKQVNTQLGEWQRLSFSLACFADEPMDFAKIVMPFYLATDAAVEIRFSDVVIQAASAENTIQCN